ncbi:hypothetical protein BS47DRAFT_424758 [Hydnum rufescens UP504]|uniref:Uncharacterized protein n=1 Tax=Hydnum rufescens UP504 TaxID=1448309 RepID=A0A9P6B633_9AGAM|nr:hypothetical protein BS47DRAFT_424758 [Hydnum rufescens UP504]
MPSQSEFPSTLAHFTSLKSLEWTNCQGFEMSTIWYPSTINDDWCTRFIQECSWNCPSLETLTFSNCFGASREWVAQYVSDPMHPGKGIWTQGRKMWECKNMQDNSYIPNCTNRSPTLPYAFLLAD